jgi:hypothetical protein
MTKTDVRRYYKAALVEVFQPPNVHQRKLGRYVWVQGYSDHPDGRLPHVSARHLRRQAEIMGYAVRLVSKPTKEDWQRP